VRGPSATVCRVVVIYVNNLGNWQRPYTKQFSPPLKGRKKKRSRLSFFRINQGIYNPDKLFRNYKKHNLRTHIGDRCTCLTCHVCLMIVLHSVRHIIIASCLLSTIVPTDYLLAQSVDSVSSRSVSKHVRYDMNADTLHRVSCLHSSSIQAFKLCLGVLECLCSKATQQEHVVFLEIKSKENDLERCEDVES
jgi:hypothetical protein